MVESSTTPNNPDTTEPDSTVPDSADTDSGNTDAEQGAGDDYWATLA